MPTNTESLNRELFRLLSKYKPKPLDAEGKATPVPEEADIFKFEFTKDGEDYGTVYVTLDDERSLTVYFGDDVTESPGDKTPGLDYDDTWSGLLHQLSSWRMTKGLRGFKTQNKDRVGDDMARRNHMRNKDKIAEGYYPMGKSRSYSDAVPSVKIVIEHSRVIEEGEQRYRNINRIFLENQDGERYLLDTKKPGIARVYARHIAEGGKVNDDRWNHVHSLCEEYSKMAGFVRATRNGQFNESAQSLVNEGIAHYQSLRESLSRMTGKRGYNAYFESWTPALMEDEGDETNLNELFVQETLDPRIESVMPILNRIHKKVSESVVDKEMNKLAEWADRLVEGPAVDANANSPTGSQSPALAHYADQLDHDASVKEDEGMFGRSKNDKRYLDKFDPTEVMNISDDPGMKAHKTTGKGSLRTSKEDLEFAFGPAGEDDTWVLEFGNGLIATIYPQSNSGGMDWIIGGNHPDTEDFVHMAYSAALDDELEEGENWSKHNNKRVGGEVDEAIHTGAALQKYRDNRFAPQNEPAKPAPEQGVAEDLDANQKRVGQLGPTEKVGKKGAVGKLVGANENFINQADQAVTTEEDEMAEGILDNIKNMFKPKDPTPVTPITADDIAKGYQTQPEFAAQVKKIAMQQGMSPEDLIKQLQQQVGAGASQNATVPTQAFHEGLLDTLKKGVQGVKKFGQDAKAAGKEAWDEVVPQLKQDWKHPIQAAMAKEGEMDEGEHTQHYDDANKFTGDIDHGDRPPTDWSVDPIEAGTDRIHNKVSSMLKKLSKSKDKEEVKEGQEDLDAILRIIRK
jgi:hypothetical protein